MIAAKSKDQDKSYQGLPSNNRVMIVDDQSTTRNILKRVIKNSGHEVITASSGEEALQYLQEMQFTLVLLDIVMPKMDGFEVLREIRQCYSMSALPVIMVSVRDGSDDILKAFSIGANDYVAKPIDLPVICARIEAHLAYKKFNDNNEFARRKLEKNVAKKQTKLLSKNKVIEFEIEKRKKAEQHILENEAYFESLIENVNDIIAVIEEDGTIVYESSSLERILGYSPEERIGNKVFELVHPEDVESVRFKLAQAFSEPGVTFTEIARFLHKDGNWRLLESIGRCTVTHDGKRHGIVNARDVTERSSLSEQLSHQASHDTLTGLINRHEFERRLENALEACRVEQSESALFYMDLDQFKIINDNCGHVAGDELLKQISTLLRQEVWKRDTLARLGGDEFVVLLEHCTSIQAKKVGNKILKLIEEYRFIWNDQSFTISVSIGLVPIDANSKNSVEIMKHADSACFAAKDAGRNRVHTFHDDDKTLTMLHGEMQWVAQINQALDTDRFCLFAQPIVAVGSQSTNLCEHYEILLRMRGDEDQFISPGLFLPAAERYNLSQRLDSWVIDSAFNWLMDHPGHLNRLSKCAINLSGLSLGNEKFLGDLVKRFEESNIPPEKICFEVTETATIANLADARKFIDTLRELGCLFALDDFGSGLSSFAYLKSLPVDYLKIDGIFVKDIETNPINFAMVKSINEIGKVMGKKTIAEFVENVEIMQKLEEIGVDYAQGYYIEKPKPIN